MLVLEILSEREAYGYEIAQAIGVRSHGAFAPSEGALYPALHRLEADGAVTAAWRAGERGPRRRYYRITPAGQALLADTREQWESVVTAVGRVAARPTDA
jgi:PadR family transcriptional regulator PadR